MEQEWVAQEGVLQVLISADIHTCPCFTESLWFWEAPRILLGDSA